MNLSTVGQTVNARGWTLLSPDEARRSYLLDRDRICMVRASSYRRADTLIEMDTVIRSISDEENGIFESWIMYHVPDGATREELIQYIEEDDTFYPEACEFFARYISNLICHGEWSIDGYTTEFFNSEAYEEPRS